MNLELQRPTRSFSECVGAILDIERVAKGLKQTEVAKLMSAELNTKVHQGYISQIATGETTISLERLPVYCKILGVSESYIMKQVPEMQALSGKSIPTLLNILKSDLQSRFAKTFCPRHQLNENEEVRFKASEAGRLLKNYRQFQNLNLSSVLCKLERIGTPSWLISKNKEGLEQFEKGTIDKHLCWNELEPLVMAYGVPPMMLDSLLSKPVKKQLICESLEEMRPVTTKDKEFGYGEGTTYYVPHERLDDTNVDFILLTLDANKGMSEPHTHPGDEMIFCLRGEIECCLENSGMSARLQSGDYVHFYAENPHWVKSISDEPACIFIIRFYQLNGGGTRRRTRNAVEQLTKLNSEVSCGKRKAVQALERLLEDREVTQYLTEVTTLPHKYGISYGDIYDPAGLARLLGQLMKSRNLSAEDVINKAKKIGWERKKDVINRFIAGRPVKNANHFDINSLAKILSVPAVILANYMLPSAPTCVKISRNSDIVPIDGPSEFKDTVTYSLPRRNLACSDIGVTFLKLAPSASSPWNEHPGYELVMPLSGKVQIELKNKKNNKHVDDNKVVDSESFEFCHFESDGIHRVTNCGNIDAEMLVIRFHSSSNKKRKPSDILHDDIDASELQDAPSRSILSTELV